MGSGAEIRSLGMKVWLLGANCNRSSLANGFHKQGLWRGEELA
jgi:hypothetical protein